MLSATKPMLNIIMEDNGDEALRKIREVLDSSIDEGTAKKLIEESQTESSCCGSQTESLLNPDVHIDVEDYCKFLKDCGSQALSCVPLDSRTLIPPHQAKLDSQQTPHSLSDLQNRIASFDIIQWSNKPDCVSALNCARFGWKLTEWGFLSCVTCKQILHVPSRTSKSQGYNGMSWAARLRQSMESSGHLSTCPWTRLSSPVELLSLPKGGDVQKYFRDAIYSFRRLKKYPNIDNYCHEIMSSLDLAWLMDMTAEVQHQYEIEDSGVTQDMVRDLVLFLAVSGWYMIETDQTIQCNLCLRHISLHLYCDAEESAKSSSVGIMPKTFDPVKNHWNWCPWRQFLSKNRSSTESPPMRTSSNGSPMCNSNKCDSADYTGLLDTFREEFESLRLSYKTGQKSGHELLTSVAALMDDFVAVYGTSEASGLTDSSTVSSSKKNVLPDSPQPLSKRKLSDFDTLPSKRLRPVLSSD